MSLAIFLVMLSLSFPVGAQTATVTPPNGSGGYVLEEGHLGLKVSVPDDQWDLSTYPELDDLYRVGLGRMPGGTHVDWIVVENFPDSSGKCGEVLASHMQQLLGTYKTSPVQAVVMVGAQQSCSISWEAPATLGRPASQQEKMLYQTPAGKWRQIFFYCESPECLADAKKLRVGFSVIPVSSDVSLRLTRKKMAIRLSGDWIVDFRPTLDSSLMFRLRVSGVDSMDYPGLSLEEVPKESPPTATAPKTQKIDGKSKSGTTIPVTMSLENGSGTASFILNGRSFLLKGLFPKDEETKQQFLSFIQGMETW